ncbi:hypothetical protein FC777_13140 [Clostridium botulinum]|nr:hypothetical protein [Clostridium botulinum]
MKEWIYHNPKFECDEINYELLRYSPWSGHRNFAYDFVNFFKPENIVELGSHYGCSAFAFIQAIKDFNLNTKFTAIDTWAGDDFTKNDYENDIYSIFNKTINKFYINQNVNMLRMVFDKALLEFSDNSIDVIHIDGSHHYDDVKHDFYSWFPKIKDDGIIILHDISEDVVLGDIMGSNRFWNELCSKFKNTVSFDFSWGLGIIFLSEKKFNLFSESISLNKYQRLNNKFSVEYREELRKNYFTLQDNKTHINSLYEQLKIKDTHLNKYQEDTNKKNIYIEELEKHICDRDNGLNQYEKSVKEKDKYIKELEKHIYDINKALDEYKENVEGKDKYIKELEEKISKEYILEIENLKEEVKEKENFIHDIEQRIEKSFFGKFIKK